MCVCLCVCSCVCLCVCLFICLCGMSVCPSRIAPWMGTAGVALTAMGRLLSGIWGFFFNRVYEAYIIDSLEMSQEQVTWPAVRHGIA